MTTQNPQLDEVVALVREHEFLLETMPVDEVIGYIRSGNIDAALEGIGTSASLQESCMNQGRADSLYSLYDAVHRYRTMGRAF